METSSNVVVLLDKVKWYDLYRVIQVKLSKGSTSSESFSVIQLVKSLRWSNSKVLQNDSS